MAPTGKGGAGVGVRYRHAAALRPGIQAGAGVSEAGVPVLTMRSLGRCCLRPHGLGLLPIRSRSSALPPGGCTAAAADQRRTLPHTLVIFGNHIASETSSRPAWGVGGDRPAPVLGATKLHERCQQVPSPARGRPEHGGLWRHTLVIRRHHRRRGNVGREDARRALSPLAKGLVLAGARREAASALGISRRRLFELLAADR